ncbi:hypothetical protein BX600DRAFT_458295 [Xylariales sp. PMI_506]|nr:hypothetical protein BX600DRAFT_458295 [Xylariales sp. PMI_506]
MADPSIAAAEPEHRKPGRTMFVTIGSIASFTDLVKEVVSDKFLETLAGLNFVRLIVQCGPDLELFERTRPQKGYDSHWIDILGFQYTDDIRSYFLKCTPSDGKHDGEQRGMGIIMAHAGAGTILEALDFNSRLIVVPNTSLMDNHQVELAAELDKQGYLLHGNLGHLHEDVQRIETFRPSNWPPEPPANSKYRHLGDIIDDLCGPQVDPSQIDPNDWESLMWVDLLREPVEDDDERLEFMNGQITKEKTALFNNWRDKWYAQKQAAENEAREKGA